MGKSINLLTGFAYSLNCFHTVHYEPLYTVLYMHILNVTGNSFDHLYVQICILYF